jgi:hypothetical protein
VVEALEQMVDLLLDQVVLVALEVVGQVLDQEILAQQQTLDQQILVVVVVEQIHKHLLLVVLVLSSSLTQAHNNLVVEQSLQLVVRLFIPLHLVVY